MSLGRLLAAGLLGLRLLLRALALAFGALFVALLAGCLFIAERGGLFRGPAGR